MKNQNTGPIAPKSAVLAANRQKKKKYTRREAAIRAAAFRAGGNDCANRFRIRVCVDGKRIHDATVSDTMAANLVAGLSPWELVFSFYSVKGRAI